MDKTKILIAQPTVAFAQQLSVQLNHSYILYECRDGVQTWTCIQQYRPAVLVMDLTLPGVDGLEILRRLQRVEKRPKVLLTTCMLSPYLEQTIADYDVDMLMVKPCSPDLVADRVRELVRSTSEEASFFQEQVEPVEPEEKDPITDREETTSSILLRLCISPKRKGFEYLQDCVELYLQDPCLCVTKHLYPQVAKKHRTNALAVERAIRQAIHAAWEERNDRIWREYFLVDRSGTVPRPTNAEFIAQLAERQRTAAGKRTILNED